MPLQTNLSCSDSNLRKAEFNEGSRLQKNIYLKKKKVVWEWKQCSLTVRWPLQLHGCYWFVKQLVWGGKLAREEINYQLLGWRVREGLVGWLILTVLLS